MTRPILLLALALGLALPALGLTACGEREETTIAPSAARAEPLRLVLDYVPNADHAGIYLAQARGLFAAAGLKVELQTPTTPSAPLRLVAAGRADLAISYEPELLLARDRGLRVQSVGALVQVPLTSLMSVGGRPLRDPRQLRDATVATAGIPYQDAYLRTILDRARVPRDSVRTVDVGFNLLPAMISRRADATLGAFWNIEGVELQRAGRRPSILRMERVGIPTYDELVLVAREETVRNEGAKLRRFLQALARGHTALRADPAAGADALVRAERDLDRGLQLAQIRATLPAFFPAAGRPFGWQEPREWNAYARWMAENGLVDGPGVVARAFTNEFLPGEGP